MSQDGSTAYPFSEHQVRTMGYVKCEFLYMIDDLKKADGMLAWCDSINAQQTAIVQQKDTQLVEKDNIIGSQVKIISLKDEQIKLSKEQVNVERKKKRLFMGTTAVTLVLLVISLF